MRKSMSKRLIATVVLTTMIAGNSTVAVYANEVKKDESVYVTLKSDGTENEKIVSDWIHSNDSNATVTDKSSLEEIKNVKGDEKPAQNGENITWTLKDNDVYYQGKSTKQLPISVSIKYYLDGSEISKEDIAGKSGRVKISLKFTNNSYEEKQIGDKMRKIYTPLSVAGGMALPTDTFKNIKINEGKVISEGSTNVASFAVLPGMKETLDIDGASSKLNVNLTDTIEVEADANNFSLGPIMMAATTMMPELDTLDAADDIDKLNDSLKKLKDASDKLLDGTNKLKSGTDGATGKLADAKKMMNNPKMKEKLGLITNDNNVLRANRLIEDALVAEGMDTSKIKDIMKLMTEGNYDKANALIDDAKSLEADKKYLIGNAKKLKELADSGNVQKIVSDAENVAKAYGGMSKDTKVKLTALLKSGSDLDIAKAHQLLVDTLSAKKNADSLLKNKDAVVGQVKSLKSDSDKLMQSAPATLKSAQDFMDATGKTVSNINALMEKSSGVIKDGKTLMGRTQNFEEKELNPYVAKIMQSVGAKTPDEALVKINVMINKIEATMPEVDKMMGEINKFYEPEQQKQLSAMVGDVKDYGKAYLALKSYILADAAQNKLLAQSSGKPITDQQANNLAFDKLYKSIKAYGSAEATLKPLVDKLKNNPNLFTTKGMTDDALKINAYNEQIKTLLLKVNGSKDKVMGLEKQLKELEGFLPLVKEGIPLLRNANTILERAKNLEKGAAPLIESVEQLYGQAPDLLSQADGVIKDSKDLMTQSKGVVNKANILMGTADKLMKSDDAKGLEGYFGKLKSMEESAEGAKLMKLADTFNKLNDTDFDSINNLKNNALVLFNDAKGAEDTLKSVKTLAADIKKNGKDKEVLGKVTKLSGDLEKSEALINEVKTLAQKSDMKDVKKASSMANTLMSMQNDLKNSTDILRITQDALSKGNVSQARSLMSSLPKLEDGVKQLSDGITQLNDGMKQFSDEGINKINDKGTTAITDVKDVLKVKDEMVQMSKKYDNFAGKDESMTSTVKFVLKTEEIKAPEVKEEKPKASTEKKTGFIEWIKNLFK